MPSQFVDLFVRAHDQASKVLNSVGKSAEGLSKKVSALGTAASVAGGILVADLVRNVTRFAQESIKMGGQVETLQRSFEKLTTAAGAHNLTLEALREATHGTVADVDLLTSANQAMMLGLPTNQLTDLMGAATKLGHAMGIDALYAVDSLTKGLGRQSKLILDNLGVVFQASDAYVWYAKQLGKTSSQLTDTEKKLGWQQYAIEMITKKAETLGDVTSDTQKAQEKWAATVKNLQTEFGKFLTIFGPLVPALETMMPLICTMAGVLIPKWLTQTNLLAAATKLKAFAMAVVNKQTYLNIAAGLKNIASLFAQKAATIAAKIADWLHTAALTAKLAVLTVGIGVIVAVAAATLAMAQMTAQAAESESQLSSEAQQAAVAVESTGSAFEMAAEASRKYSKAQGEIVYLKERVREWSEEHQKAMEMATLDFGTYGKRFKKWLDEKNFEQMAYAVAGFAKASNLSFEEAEKALYEYAAAVTYADEAVNRFAEMWNDAAAENAVGLDRVARAFDAAFDEKRFKDAANIVTQFAETHNISFDKAEDIILDAVDNIVRSLNEWELASIAVGEQQAALAKLQQENKEASEEFTGSLQREVDLIKVAASDELPMWANAFARAFSEENFDAALSAVQMLVHGTSLSLEEGSDLIRGYLEDIGVDLANAFDDAIEEVNEGIEEGLINRAQTNLEAFKNCVSGKMQAIGKDNKTVWGTIVKDTNDLIRQGLIGQAQDNIEAFVNCSTDKQAKMVGDIDGYLEDLTASYDMNIVKINELVASGRSEEAAIWEVANAKIMATIMQLENWRNMVVGAAWEETFRIIEMQATRVYQVVAARMSGVAQEIVNVVDQLGQVEIWELETGGKRSIISFIGALGDDMAKYTEEAASEMFSLWQNTFMSIEEITAMFADQMVGHSIWTDMLTDMIEKTDAAMGHINTSARLGLARFGETIERGSYGRAGVPRGAFSEKAGGAQVIVQGPLVNIEGSADRKTAELAASLVRRKLESVIVEATSSGTSVLTKRVRWRKQS